MPYFYTFLVFCQASRALALLLHLSSVFMLNLPLPAPLRASPAIPRNPSGNLGVMGDFSMDRILERFGRSAGHMRSKWKKTSCRSPIWKLLLWQQFCKGNRDS